MVVNHNMAAICESRQLRYNVKKMEKSSKKLATGYKLNTAMMMRQACRYQRRCGIM